MKFLMVNGKFYRDSNGKLITVPDNYNNELLTIGGNILTIGGKLVGDKYSGSTYPKKGDLIIIQGETYRVLKIDENIVKLLGMNDITTCTWKGKVSTITYDSSPININLNNWRYDLKKPFYSAIKYDLPIEMRAWYPAEKSGWTKYIGIYNDTQYVLSPNPTSSLETKYRAYAPSIDDVIEYLEADSSMDISNTTITPENINMMFFNTPSMIASAVWLRTREHAGNRAFRIDGNTGSIQLAALTNTAGVRPVVQADLSKISWELST